MTDLRERVAKIMQLVHDMADDVEIETAIEAEIAPLQREIADMLNRIETDEKLIAAERERVRKLREEAVQLRVYRAEVLNLSTEKALEAERKKVAKLREALRFYAQGSWPLGCRARSALSDTEEKT